MTLWDGMKGVLHTAGETSIFRTFSDPGEGTRGRTRDASCDRSRTAADLCGPNVALPPEVPPELVQVAEDVAAGKYEEEEAAYENWKNGDGWKRSW